LPIPIDAYADLVESAGYAWLNKDFAFICERPTQLHRNAAGQLHCNDGLAIAWPDGWGMWMLGGVRVDEQIVMTPQTQTLQQIREEGNEEVKRLRIERFAGRDASPADGWRRYLDEAGAKVVNRRRNDVENTREALMRSPDGLTTLVCACPSTARVYALEVPGDTTTCEQAQRFLWSGSRAAEWLTTGINIIGRS